MPGGLMEFFGHVVLQLAAGGLSVLVCWQDWRTRSVSWPAFPLLGACLLADRLLDESLGLVGWEIAGNLLTLALLVGVLGLYVRFRFQSRGLGLLDCLGSGDVLFWLVLALYLPPVQLLFFLLGSSALSLLLVIGRLVRPLPGEGAVTVPLAGIQAAGLLLLLGGRCLAPTWATGFLANHFYSLR